MPSGEAVPAVVVDALRRWPDRFPLIVMEENGSFTWASPAVTDLLGYGPDELVRLTAKQLIHPDDLADAVGIGAQNLDRERRQGRSPDLRYLYVVRLRTKDGSWRPVEMSGVDLRMPDGRISLVLGLRDFTQRQLLDDLMTLVAEGAPLPQMLTAAADAVHFVVPDGRVGIEVDYDDVVLLAHSSSGAPDHPADSVEAAGLDGSDGGGGHRWRFPLRVGEREVGAIITRTGQAAPLVYQTAWIRRVAQIVTLGLERAVDRAQLQRLALLDPLTSVANRAEVARSLARACAAGPVAVVVVDLDGFKAVNDVHGHAAGDAFLIEVARRLLRHMRPGDVVGRLGGDEFVVVCPGLDTAAAAEHLAQRLVDALADPVHTEGLLLAAGASLGVALGGPGSMPDHLLRAADAQLYAAKHRGGRCFALTSATHH